MVNLKQTDWGKEDINYFERASQSGFQITPRSYNGSPKTDTLQLNSQNLSLCGL